MTDHPGRRGRRDEEYDVVVNGVRLHVRDVGAEDALPVLVLHGLMGHRRDWDVLVDRLGERCRVVAVDQRGHGRSARTPSYRLADFADDAVALIDRLGLAPVSIVGHSMGAMVALIVAAGRHDLVDRVAVVDVVPETLTTEFVQELPGMLATMAAASYASVDEAVAEWQAGNPLARIDLLRNYVTHALVSDPDGRRRWGFDAPRLHEVITETTPSDLWSAIDAIGCSSLVVCGEFSDLTTTEQAQVVAQRLGDASVVVVPGGGHDLGVEQPEIVADAVLHFLDHDRNRRAQGAAHADDSRFRSRTRRASSTTGSTS